MKIKFSKSFVEKLKAQLRYISLDKPLAARRFNQRLRERIREIPKFPLKYRKSIYFEDENIRDLVFEGYTVVFRIHDNEIQVFGFVKMESSL